VSTSVSLPPPKGASPPGRRRGTRQRFATVLAVVAGLLASMSLGVAPAHAGSHGVGYDSALGFIGAYNTGQNSDGTQAYCMDPGVLAPFSPTGGGQVVSSFDSMSPRQLAELNYVLSKWGQSSDPNVTAAVALYTWSVADPGYYNNMGGEDHYLARVPASQRATVDANLDAFSQEAAVNAVTNPSIGVSITMSDQYHGTLTVTARPASLGVAVSLTNAVFANGASSRTVSPGTYAITGTPADGVPSYRIGASATADGTGYGSHITFYTSGAGEQRIAHGVSGRPAQLDAATQTPFIELDFQPEITTAVSSKFVQAGQPFNDQLTVTVTKGTWIRLDGTPIPVTAEGTLYGPFDAQPAQAATPPAGAPVAGTERVTLTAAGTYTTAGTIRASSSGFYVWVWKIDKNAHGANAKYLTASFTDAFGLVPETSVSPFQPEAVSTANGRLVNPGDQVTDTIKVTSANGPWLKLDGKPIPVVFTGTAYQVPGSLPPVQGSVPAGAVPVGVVTVTAEGPGSYTSPVVTVPNPGFVTWVWTALRADQPANVRDYLAGDFTDFYGIPQETHSVRWPLTITSQVREYNVVPNGRAFDTITITGFPANHPEFTGDGYWNADATEVVNTVYGPFATDEVLPDDLDLSTAPVLTSVAVPAKNGVYKIGYTDQDIIRPTEPGYYVVVTTFVGDDRVQPFQSSPADILERFYVPTNPPSEQPPTVITQATETVPVGEPFSDTALVQGTLPTGAYLVFRAYGPLDTGAPPVCETPFYESAKITVTQAGIYRSGDTTVDKPGNVYWVETLYGPKGDVLVTGKCGAPGETTVVTPPPPVKVTTKATPEVQLGEPARDTAIVTGAVPEGATVVFRAYRQTSDNTAGGVCTDAELVFTTRPVPVPGAGEFTSEDVVFDKPGTYFWVETLLDENNEIIHVGQCGAPDETTIVTDKPTPPPPGPRADTGGELAVTGTPGWMPLGIIASLALLGAGAALLFGRRLTTRREAEDRTREEAHLDD